MSNPQPGTYPEVMKQHVRDGFAAAADGYDTTGTEFFTAMGEHLVTAAQVLPGAVVLDAGCGKGAVTIPAARAAGPDGHVTGLDLAAPMLVHAQTQTAQQGLTNVSFTEGDAEAPPFPAGSFDAILAGNLIQFLPRPAAALRRWRTLLAPGGVLALGWGLAEDPRWLPVIATFDDHMPGVVPGFTATMRRPPFDAAETLERLLADCWYQAVSTVTHTVTMTYQAPAQWWAACQSQAPWAVCWRHIPADQLEGAKRDAFTLLDQLREPAGTLTRTLTFACTAGRKDGQ